MEYRGGILSVFVVCVKTHAENMAYFYKLATLQEVFLIV